jgi:hypothetical protein
MRLGGRKNGELLALAELEFDVLLTLDKSVPFQQQISSRRLAVLVVRARSNRIEDLIPCIPECLAALERIGPGEVVRVGRDLGESGPEQ